MQSTQVNGNDILEILDHLVDSEVDAYDALDKMEYLTELMELNNQADLATIW